MPSLEFKSSLGLVKVSRPSGAGEEWQVLVNNYNQGNIVKRKGEWVGMFNARSVLKPEHVAIIGRMIDEKSPG